MIWRANRIDLPETHKIENRLIENYANDLWIILSPDTLNHYWYISNYGSLGEVLGLDAYRKIFLDLKDYPLGLLWTILYGKKAFNLSSMRSAIIDFWKDHNKLDEIWVGILKNSWQSKLAQLNQINRLALSRNLIDRNGISSYLTVKNLIYTLSIYRIFRNLEEHKSNLVYKYIWLKESDYNLFKDRIVMNDGCFDFCIPEFCSDSEKTFRFKLDSCIRIDRKMEKNDLVKVRLEFLNSAGWNWDLRNAAPISVFELWKHSTNLVLLPNYSTNLPRVMDHEHISWVEVYRISV